MINLDLPFVTYPEDSTLLNLLVIAHSQSAVENENASLLAMMNAGLVTGKVENGLASAIMALGGHHAPITDAKMVYDIWTQKDVNLAIERGMYIPGLGNSFYKESIDPKWLLVDTHLKRNYPEEHARIWELHSWAKQAGKNIFPNAALYTAVSCGILGVFPGTEVALVILARLPQWTAMWMRQNDSHRLIR